MTETATLLSDQEVEALLQQALRHLDANDLFQAEALAARVREQRPSDPNVLHVLGMIRRVQGQFAEAEDFYRRSLAQRPDQAPVHHNLGNLLLSLGRNDEAAEAEREAIRLKPNFAEAFLNLGKAQSALGQFADAEKSFRRALWLRPGYPFALQSLGAVLNDLGKPKDAEIVLRQALAAGSSDPRQVAALEHNLGVALNLQERAQEAVALFDAAKAKVPELVYVDHNRANALQMLGRFEEAVEAYRQAVARNPLDVGAHRDLNDLLYRLGRDDEFLLSFDEASALYPEVGELPLAKADFQLLRGDLYAARQSFELAAQLLPASVTPHDGLGLVLARQGDFEGAIREHETALRMEPENAPAWRNFAETLLRAGDAEKGRHAAEQALAIEPTHQGALAAWGTALDMLDDPRGESLNDYENFVQVFELAPPEGYSDMESFNRDLNAYLDGLHRDKREFLRQTLRGGTQTLDNMFGKKRDLVERLRAEIDKAVAAYIARMKEDDSHPLLKRRRAQFAYTDSWSSRLHDCGFHTNHFHPKGWISSAYYVALPDAVGDAEGKQGWIKFGEPGFEAPVKDPVRRVVQPRAGTLVLFPSYMWHGTVPFRSAQARTTIAFDVVPR